MVGLAILIRFESFHQSDPGQQRALDSYRELPHTLEGFNIPEVFGKLCRLPFEHLLDRLRQRFHFLE